MAVTLLMPPVVAAAADASLRLSLTQAVGTEEAAPPPQAADDEGSPTFSLALYGWLLAVDGNVGVAGTRAPVDKGPDDVLSDLRGAVFGHFEMNTDPWILFVDAMYVKLNSEQQLPLSRLLDVDIEQFVLAVAGGYRFGTWPLGDGSHPTLTLDIFGGLQYTHLDVSIAITGGLLPLQTRGNTDWVDPVIGGQLDLQISNHWAIWGRGYVGGFGIGTASDLVWNLTAAVGWSINETFSLHIGYRVLDYDYARGSGSDRFEYDITLHGPILAAEFRF